MSIDLDFEPQVRKSYSEMKYQPVNRARPSFYIHTFLFCYKNIFWNH